MHYELWDHESGNLLGTYPTEAAALQVVAETVLEHGRESIEVATLLLGYDDGRGGGETIAMGAPLADLALNQKQIRRVAG